MLSFSRYHVDNARDARTTEAPAGKKHNKTSQPVLHFGYFVDLSGSGKHIVSHIISVAVTVVADDFFPLYFSLSLTT